MVTRSKAAASRHRAPTKPAAAKERLDPIPYWPQLKLDIVRRYGAAYSTIASRQPGLSHYWIDGFIRPGADDSASPRPREAAGAGAQFVPGSPLNALLVTPPFRHHYLVNMDGRSADVVRRAVDGRADVTVLEGGSRALIEDILPRVRQEDYRRALCVLDPCGPGLDWRAIEMAGRLRTIDLFVAFGDAPGDMPAVLKRRLREDAGFANVLDPLLLRDQAGRTAAHLFFASRNNMANGIVEDIFTTYRDGQTDGTHA
jgi:hypothetical protein